MGRKGGFMKCCRGSLIAHKPLLETPPEKLTPYDLFVLRLNSRIRKAYWQAWGFKIVIVN